MGTRKLVNVHETSTYFSKRPPNVHQKIETSRKRPLTKVKCPPNVHFFADVLRGRRIDFKGLEVRKYSSRHRKALRGFWSTRERFMSRKSIYHEGDPHANCWRWPQRANFALWGCLREFEGLEARGQSNREIKKVNGISSILKIGVERIWNLLFSWM